MITTAIYIIIRQEQRQDEQSAAEAKGMAHLGEHADRVHERQAVCNRYFGKEPGFAGDAPQRIDKAADAGIGGAYKRSSVFHSPEHSHGQRLHR